MALTKKQWVTTAKGNQFEVDLPAVRMVCPRCKGSGKHVNPAIDGDGISPEEFGNDPDFEEAYFAGLYDVTCEECNGQNVVFEVDLDRLTPKMLSRLERFEKQASQDRYDEQMEIRLGC